MNSRYIRILDLSYKSNLAECNESKDCEVKYELIISHEDTREEKGFVELNFQE